MMRAQALSAALLALAPFHSLAAALPGQTLEIVKEIVEESGLIFRVYALPNNTDTVTKRDADVELAGLEKRDWCNTGASFSASDANALKNELQNNNPNGLEYLESRHLIEWSWGTAKICVNNWYFFENTHIKRWEAGWATGYIKDSCCGGSSSCVGGQCTAHGDSGLGLEARLMHSARDCPT